jgi:tetratricopeptide (TPR) repeat protein
MMPRARRPALLCVLLVAVTWAIYGQVRQFPLVDFDDLSYVTDNPHVSGGLTAANSAWAFTHAYDGYWAPLTWLSYMADASRSGDSGAYHVTNVVLHAASACVLFWVLWRMTRREWPSAIVAAIFAVHPVHVESVAWVAERKDVLSGLFFFVTLWAYARYVERPRWTRYGWVAVAFACGLLSKPIVVTLPVILLLLDVWPLGRVALGGRPVTGLDDKPRRGAGKPRAAARRDTQPQMSGWAAVREKLPLAVMAVAASIVTIVTQRDAGAIAAIDTTPLATRVANAFVSPAVYLLKMVWPGGLAAIYPYPSAAPVAEAAVAAAALAAITACVLRARRPAPYLLIGWLWYLVMLLPVLGLIQAGPQARADRYTYLSMVGISIMAVWGLDRLVAARPAAARAVAIPAGLILAVYAGLAWKQVQYWRDGETVFRRALSVTAGNYVAHAGLAAVLRTGGRFDAAIAEYGAAIEVAPRFPEAYAGLGQTLLASDRIDAAAIALGEAVRLAPADAVSRSNLGTALARAGRLDEAAVHYREAIRLAPGRAEAHAGLALVLDHEDRLDEALREFAEAIRLRPGAPDAHFNLGIVLARRGRVAEALPHFREASRLDPASGDGHLQLGNALAMQGQMDEAIAELTAAARLKPADPDVHSNLGLALAAGGRFDEAIARLDEAIRLAPDRQELRDNLAYVQARRREALR